MAGSALLQIFNDVLMTTDAGDTMGFVLLDLSSAFDFVDHRIIQFGPKVDLDGNSIDLGTFTPYFTSDVKDLGFYLDNCLKLDKQIYTVVSISFYHIYQLAKVKSFFRRKSFETVPAFISSQLNYCNSLCWVTTLFHLLPSNGPKREPKK